MTKPLLIFDGMNILKTVAAPSTRLDNGYEFSFVRTITSVIKKFNPRGAIVVWEGGDGGRKLIHEGYKSSRTASSDKIRAARERVKLLSCHLGLTNCHADGYEADDVIAQISNTAQNTIIVSADKDFLPLINDNVSLFSKVQRFGEGERVIYKDKKLITKKNFTELIGFQTPQQFLEYLCITGDGVDEVPGIVGVGGGFVKGWLMGMEIPPAKSEKIDEFRKGPDFERNMKLIDLRGITGLDIKFVDADFNPDKARDLLSDLNFASMLKGWPTWIQPYKDMAG